MGLGLGVYNVLDKSCNDGNFSGSVHDSCVLKTSKVWEYIVSLNDGWLIGDSGYKWHRNLYTPIIDPQPGHQMRYNNFTSSSL